MTANPAQELTRRKRDVERRVGPWLVDDISLGHGVSTIGETARGRARKLQAIVQLVSDFAGAPLPELRVLDLACGEGLFGVELARQGAEVVATDARETALEKVRFVKDELGLDRLELVHDDVRSLSRERYGEFDAVLCLGILYHLPAPDGVELLRAIARVCTGIAVVDTHHAVLRGRPVEVAGRTYHATAVREHDPATKPADRVREDRASIDNITSDWLTLPSLYNALAAAGFTSVAEVRVPRLPPIADRTVVVARPGRAVRLHSIPAAESMEPLAWPERERAAHHASQRLTRRTATAVFWRLPAPLRQRIARWR